MLHEIKDSLAVLKNEEAKDYWNLLIEHGKKTDNYYCCAYCNYYLAIRLQIEGEYVNSFLAFQESKSNYENIKHKPGLARVHNGLGYIYENLTLYDRALSNYYLSSYLFKELKEENYGTVLLNIGGILVQLDSLNKAMQILIESESILSYSGDTSGLLNCYINLAAVYLAQNKQDSALKYLSQKF